MGNNLKFQNPRKAKKERIDTLFKKACVLSRVFVHNPPKNGRIGLLVEYEGSWKIFLSEENQEWPIDFKKLKGAEIRYVRDIRTEKEAKYDFPMENFVTTTGTGTDVVAVDHENESSSSDLDDSCQAYSAQGPQTNMTPPQEHPYIGTGSAVEKQTVRVQVRDGKVHQSLEASASVPSPLVKERSRLLLKKMSEKSATLTRRTPRKSLRSAVASS